jgi:hypothetical protein
MRVDDRFISVDEKSLEDRENFLVMYRATIRRCTDGHDFMIGSDRKKTNDDRFKILHKVFSEETLDSILIIIYTKIILI